MEGYENLTAKQLEELLKKKKKEEKAANLQKRVQYELERDRLVNDLVKDARKLHEQMSFFKAKAMETMEQFRQTAKEYGDIKSSSKGGFGLRSSDGSMKVVLERNSKTEYDERAHQAEELLKEFLIDKVRKRDQKAYRAIESLLTRNRKTGQYNPVSINSLLAIEDNYDDERWIKAMQLFRESFQVIDVSLNVAFYQKDNLGKDELIPLTFSSI